MAMSGSGDMISAVCLVSVPSPAESVSASVGLGLGVVSTILYKDQIKQSAYRTSAEVNNNNDSCQYKLIV